MGWVGASFSEALSTRETKQTSFESALATPKFRLLRELTLKEMQNAEGAHSFLNTESILGT